MPEAATIYIIHPDTVQATAIAQQLERCTHLEVQIAPLQLAAADYADMAAAPDTGAVIVAQHLDPHSALGYAGIDVAEHLRRVRPGLPIYLLVRGEEDLASREAVVEQVILEDDLLQRCPVYAARILRAMGRYLDAMSEQELRYRDLVARKLDGTLSESEEDELTARRTEIELPFSGSAIEYAKTWEQSLREEQRLLDEFTTELQSLLRKLP
jgi:hypothetical protein